MERLPREATELLRGATVHLRMSTVLPPDSEVTTEIPTLLLNRDLTTAETSTPPKDKATVADLLMATEADLPAMANSLAVATATTTRECPKARRPTALMVFRDRPSHALLITTARAGSQSGPRELTTAVSKSSQLEELGQKKVVGLRGTLLEATRMATRERPKIPTCKATSDPRETTTGSAFQPSPLNQKLRALMFFQAGDLAQFAIPIGNTHYLIERLEKILCPYEAILPY